MQELNPFANTLIRRLIDERFYLDFEANCCVCDLFDILLLDAYPLAVAKVATKKRCVRSFITALEHIEYEGSDDIEIPLSNCTSKWFKTDSVFSFTPSFLIEAMDRLGLEGFTMNSSCDISVYRRLLRVFDMLPEVADEYEDGYIFEERLGYIRALSTYALRDLEMMNLWIDWFQHKGSVLFPELQEHNSHVQPYGLYYFTLLDGTRIALVDTAFRNHAPSTVDVRVLDRIAIYIVPILFDLMPCVCKTRYLPVFEWFLLKIGKMLAYCDLKSCFQNVTDEWIRCRLIISLQVLGVGSNILAELPLNPTRADELMLARVGESEEGPFFKLPDLSYYHRYGATQFDKLLLKILEVGDYSQLRKLLPYCDIEKVDLSGVSRLGSEEYKHLVLFCRYFSRKQLETLLRLNLNESIKRYLTLALNISD